MTNEPNENILSDDEVQDSSAGNAAGTEGIDDVQRELKRLKLEVENAHRLAEQERKRADDLIGLVGNTSNVQSNKAEPVDPAQAWNKLANELPPDQFEARVAQKVTEEVMKHFQTLGAQSQKQQNERQYFNTAYPELAKVKDRIIIAAYQSVLDRNPQMQNYGIETKAEYIAKELRDMGFGANDTIKQDRKPPKDAPSSPITSTQTHEKDEYAGLTQEQIERKAFKKMLDSVKPAYKTVR